jgi:hypothetical protein
LAFASYANRTLLVVPSTFARTFIRRVGSFDRSSVAPFVSAANPAIGWSVSALISVNDVTAVISTRRSSASHHTVGDAATGDDW